MPTVGNIKVEYKQANHDFSTRWQEFKPCTQTLHQGWVKAPGRRPLAEDLIFEKDSAIPLRDGLRMWADIFRPPSSSNEPVPAIIAWSPYGKEGNGQKGFQF
jgi:predicted acyl esterase